MPRRRSRQLHAARTAAARALFVLDGALETDREGAVNELVDRVRVLLDLTLSETDRTKLSGYVAAHPGADEAPTHWANGDPAPYDVEEVPGSWPT